MAARPRGMETLIVDLDFTDEQRMLAETVRSLLVKHSPPEAVRFLETDPAGYSDALWRECARMGLCGLSIPERYGGAGQGALETAILYEELGRALVSAPHFASAVMAAGVILAGDSDAARDRWLEGIASGDSILTIAWQEPDGGCGPDGVALRAAGGRLSGTKILVPFAPAAERMITLARDDDGTVGVYLVDAAATQMTPIRTLATDASWLVRFDGTPGERIGGWDAWDDASIDGMIALAAYAVGGARRAHEMATVYAKERVQFDKPIGAFQAIAHPLADTATEIEGAAVLVWQAAWMRSAGRDARTPAAMAKMFAADVFRRTTKLGQQVYGGIGFTTGIDMQLYFRRAKQIEIAWWDPRFLEERIAAAELDAATPFVSIDAG